MYVIAVINQKGGVAKTTTTVSLGAAMSELGYRVLAIDMDAQGDLTIALGKNPFEMEHSLANFFIDGMPLHSLIEKTDVSGMDLIPANSNLSLAEQFLTVQPDRDLFLKRGFMAFDDYYDCVLMDCSAHMGVLTTNTMAVSDMLLIPVHADFFSLAAVRNVIMLVSRVRAAYNPRLIYRLTLTMFDGRVKSQRLLAEKLQETFKEGMLPTVINMDSRLRTSQQYGIPITVYAPRSKGAEQYRALARDVVQCTLNGSN